MGSLEGHLLPGTFMMVFGFWWTFSLINRYFKGLSNSSLTKTPFHFKSTASFSRFEGFVKIFAAICGITAEVITGLDPNHGFINSGNSQHLTMYLFFGINGIFDLSVHYGYPVPKDSDYMSLSLALIVESLLFCFHLHGRTALDIHVHTLLIISMIVSLLTVLAECNYRDNILVPFCRCLCALLQGTWFYTIGFILYPPFGKVMDESHDNLMLITSLFCWQIAALIALMSSIGICFYFKYRPILNNIDFLSNNNSFNTYSDIDYKTLNNKTEGNTDESNEQKFIEIKGKDSLNEIKYSVICTSDEDI